MYKTLPKNVISFFPNFPHFVIFAQIRYHVTRAIAKTFHGYMESSNEIVKMGSAFEEIGQTMISNM